MNEELESLRAEVGALRVELAEARAERSAAMTRRRLLTGLAGLGAAGAGGIAAAPTAGADDGDPLTLGAVNTATGFQSTILRIGSGAELPADEGQSYAFEIEDHEQANGLRIRSTDRAASFAGDIEGLVVRGFQSLVAHSSGLVASAGIASGTAVGVYAESETSPALYVKSSGGAHIHIEPAQAAGPPELESPELGAIRMDSNAELWLCVAVADGAATWTRLSREDTAAGRMVPITPVRVLDTRVAGGRPTDSPVVPGQKKGPLLGGQAITLDLAGIGELPTSASGVVGNLTVVSPSYSGYLTAGPSDSSTNTSSLNFTTGAIVANSFTSALGPDGLTIRASGTTANRYELVVDITAYIT